MIMALIMLNSDLQIHTANLSVQHIYFFLFTLDFFYLFYVYEYLPACAYVYHT